MPKHVQVMLMPCQKFVQAKQRFRFTTTQFATQITQESQVQALSEIAFGPEMLNHRIEKERKAS